MRNPQRRPLRVHALPTLVLVALLSGCDDDESAPPVQPRGAPPMLVGYDPAYGIEPFRLDPVSGNIALLLDTNTNTPGAAAGPGVVIGAHVLFPANDGVHGTEPWITDGNTAERVADLCAGTCGEILQLLASGTQAFIIARGPGGGETLWVSDGTAAGTRLLRAEQDDEDSYQLRLIAVVGGNLLFTEGNPDGSVSLWRSDGSAAGTSSFKTIATDLTYVPRISTGVVLDGKAWFAIEEQLWSSDTSSAGTALLPVTVSLDQDALPIAPVLLGGKVYVAGTGIAASVVAVPATRQMQANGSTLCYWSDRNLHVTDGTTEGSRVALIDGFPGSTPFGKILASPTGCYFLLPDGGFSESSTLWLARPGDAGNIAVQVFANTLRMESLTTFGSAGAKLFFPIRPATTGAATQLWYVEDETATRVADMAAGNGIGTLAGVGADALLFSNNGEPWRSDGTASGTRLVADINHASTLNGFPDRALRINGNFYFQTNSSDGIPGSDVFISDGTPAGTHATALPSTLMTGPGLTTTQGRYFVAQGSGVQELRLLGNSAVESTLLGSVCRGEYTAEPAFASGNGFVLAAVVACGELLLWKSDGTPVGTTHVVLGSVAEYVADTIPDIDQLVSQLHLHATPSRFYLGVCYESFRCTIQVTDGTLAGTALLGETPRFTAGVVLGEALYLIDGGAVRIATHTPVQAGAAVNVLPTGLAVSSATRMGNQLIFNANAGDSGSVPVGRQLWRSDGTAAGTNVLVNIGARDIVDWAPAGGSIFFTTLLRNDPPSTGELWRTDGTPEGTIELSNAVITSGSVASYLDCTDNIVINTFLAGAFPKLYANEGEAWFLRQGPRSGINLWFSNGTVAGTRRMTTLPDYNCAIAGLF